MRQISRRATLLLEQLSQASQRSRSTLVVLQLIAILVLSASLNEKFGATDTRILVRTENLEANDLQGAVKDAEEEEVDYLRRVKILQMERVELPAIGVSFSTGDIHVVGLAALCLVLLWFNSQVARERAVLAQFLRPLTTKRSSLILPADGANPEGDVRDDQDQDREVLQLLDVVQGHFVLVHSARRGIADGLPSIVLVVTPCVVAATAVGLNLHHDFIRVWVASGEPFFAELIHHASGTASAGGSPTREPLAALYAYFMVWKMLAACLLLVPVTLLTASCVHYVVSLSDLLTVMYDHADGRADVTRSRDEIVHAIDLPPRARALIRQTGGWSMPWFKYRVLADWKRFRYILVGLVVGILLWLVGTGLLWLLVKPHVPTLRGLFQVAPPMTDAFQSEIAITFAMAVGLATAVLAVAAGVLSSCATWLED